MGRGGSYTWGVCVKAVGRKSVVGKEGMSIWSENVLKAIFIFGRWDMRPLDLRGRNRHVFNWFFKFASCTFNKG